MDGWMVTVQWDKVSGLPGWISEAVMYKMLILGREILWGVEVQCHDVALI